MIIKCAVVDDEPLAVELLASYVKKIPFLELCGKYTNATDALHGIGEQPVDLLFLDIQMPELNGLELSRMVPENTRIVFTTAFNQYAVDGFRVNALDYLLKPISYADFLEACNKAMHRGVEGLCENLHRAVSPSHPVAHEHEGYRADVARISLYQGASLFHCAEEQNPRDRA